MDLPRYHRLRPAYYRLEGCRCRACDRAQFPPRTVCRHCGGDELSPCHLSPRGTVHSFTEMTTAAAGFPPPYLMALVELDDGVRLAAQLTDVAAEEVEIGMAVEMVTRRLQEQGELGYLVYGYKFRPLLPRSGGP